MYVITLAIVPTRSEVLVPTDSITAIPCLSQDFRTESPEMHPSFSTLQNLMSKLSRRFVFNKSFLILEGVLVVAALHSCPQ